ncbi:putative pentatricopeptide repeat-containing protein [Vigna angularis]|uniref:Putative pentatricopeptide repeat-containing protein n=1 Tax=Phaseolus angularis TaxID=3914 RepID=A0A8T0JJJ5_PHAAN|nr:putative pentatricopeptide repeat-containing protein [Vigna angularis]
MSDCICLFQEIVMRMLTVMIMIPLHLPLLVNLRFITYLNQPTFTMVVSIPTMARPVLLLLRFPGMRRFVCNEARKFPLLYSANTFNHIGNIGQGNFHLVDVAAVHSECGTNAELALFEALRGVKPNSFALVNLIGLASELKCPSFGKQLHSYVSRSGYFSHIHVSTSLVKFYVRMRSFSDARALFDEISEPNVVTWNTMISGYVHAGQFRSALTFFTRLYRSHVRADAFSFTSVLFACSQLSLFKLGSSIHCKTVKLGMDDSTVVANCLIDMYGKCGPVEQAVKVFSETVEKDDISWNSIIAASANNGYIELAYRLLHLMPNPDTVSYNGLINGIAQVGNMEDAVRVLSSLPNPNSSSWNSVITGFVNRNRTWEALNMFCKMHLRNVQKDEFTFSIILSGIAGLAALKDIKPDGITFLNLISACSHDEIPLEVALAYFQYMIDEYKIAPSIEHCCSMIRLMGQQGELRRAESMIHEFGFESCGVVWRALLGACGTQEDLQVAEIAAAKVIELERDEDYVYVMMSNMYASFGRWEDVNLIRGLMSRKRLKKEAGFSWIEIDSSVSSL